MLLNLIMMVVWHPKYLFQIPQIWNVIIKIKPFKINYFFNFYTPLNFGIHFFNQNIHSSYTFPLRNMDITLMLEWQIAKETQTINVSRWYTNACDDYCLVNASKISTLMIYVCACVCISQLHFFRSTEDWSIYCNRNWPSNLSSKFDIMDWD